MLKKVKPRKIPSFNPCIIVFDEKHGVRPFFCPTEAHLHSVALKIVKERIDIRYIVFDENAQANLDEFNESLEQARQIKNEGARHAALSSLRHEKRFISEYLNGNRDFKMAQEAISRSNGDLAWKVLQRRSGAQYEGFEVFDYTPEEPPHNMPSNAKHGDRFVEPSTGTRFVYHKKHGWILGEYAVMEFNEMVFDGIEPYREREE